MGQSNLLCEYYRQEDREKELDEYVKHLKIALSATQRANKSRLFN